MGTHHLKGKRSKKLLQFTGFNVATPLGVARANVEVTCNVEVRLDPDDKNDWQRRCSESGDDGSDVLGVIDSQLKECAERILEIFCQATAAKAAASQAELDFSTCDGIGFRR